MTAMGNFFKSLDCNLENKGEELVITIKGSKEKLVKLEKKLGMLKELCSDCCCADDCC